MYEYTDGSISNTTQLLHMNPFTNKMTKPVAVLNSGSRVPLLQLMHCLKSVRGEVISENDHTFCSWIHHVRTCIVLRKWRKQRPSNQGDLDPSVTGEAGRVYYEGVDLLLISFLYLSTWLFWVAFQMVHPVQICSVRSCICWLHVLIT
jgi:hypothetical protein